MDEEMEQIFFQQARAYPFAPGSGNLRWLCAASDTDVSKLTWGELHEQAIALDGMFLEWKGFYRAMAAVAKHQGMTPYVAEELARSEAVLRRIQPQQHRLH